MKLKTYLGLIMMMFSILAFSQEDIKPVSPKDSIAVEKLLQQSKDNFSEAPEKAILYAERAYRYADSIKYYSGAATGLKNIGIAYYYQGKNVEALEYWKQAFEIFKLMGDESGEANILSNIGAIYFNGGDDAKALDYYLQALVLAEKTGDKLRILTTLNNIGGVYFNKKATQDKALPYFLKALKLSEEIDDKEGIGTTATNLGEYYFENNDNLQAIFYFDKAVIAYDNSENSPYAYNALGKVHVRQKNYELAITYHQKALAIGEKLNGNLDIVQSLKGLGQANITRGDLTNGLGYLKKAEILALDFKFSQELKEIYEDLAKSYSSLQNYQSAYIYQTKFTNIKDTLYNTDTDKKLERLQFDFDLQKKEAVINLLTKDKELQEAELNRQKLAKNAFLIGAILILFITIMLYRNYLRKVRTNKLLDQQKDEIEKLLLNTLPATIAKELQETGFAESKEYHKVSVLFSDFVDFTKLAEKDTAQELVTHLNRCIGAFDDIMGKYQLEKIKTIGDAYMCAGGIPELSEGHIVRIVMAGHEMIHFMDGINIERAELGLPPWKLRVGIHIGPLVAGVVGKKKYTYDIWGNTVNIASRMESNSEPGRVNVSRSVYELIKDQFNCTYRGKISAKNLGEVEMYFVDPLNENKYLNV
jgi:class 3 adenylate cyclase/Flp pilus assembly protein TadD